MHGLMIYLMRPDAGSGPASTPGLFISLAPPGAATMPSPATSAAAEEPAFANPEAVRTAIEIRAEIHALELVTAQISSSQPEAPTEYRQPVDQVARSMAPQMPESPSPAINLAFSPDERTEPIAPVAQTVQPTQATQELARTLIIPRPRAKPAVSRQTNRSAKAPTPTRTAPAAARATLLQDTDIPVSSPVLEAPPSSATDTSDPAGEGIKQAATGPAVGSSATASWRCSVAVHIAGFKRYPRKAKRLDLEGTTTIAVAFGAGGTVSDTKIANSSGHDVLDRAAQNIVRRASPLPAPPAGAGSVNVPVSFSLGSGSTPGSASC